MTAKYYRLQALEDTLAVEVLQALVTFALAFDPFEDFWLAVDQE
jgi:hypothetical protein